MKKHLLFLIFLLFTSVFEGCKSDKEEDPVPPSYFIEYDGGKYSFLEGVVWDFPEGGYTPAHYTHGYFLPRIPDYASASALLIPAQDPPIIISFFLSTPDSDTFKEGTYEFVPRFTDWLDEELYQEYLSSIKGKYMLSEVEVGFDANGDNIIEMDEQLRIDKGTIRVTRDFLEFDLTLTNGKTIKGRSNPVFTEKPAPA